MEQVVMGLMARTAAMELTDVMEQTAVTEQRGHQVKLQSFAMAEKV